MELHAPELYRQGVADWVERTAGRIRAGIEEGSLRPMDDDESLVDAYVGLVRDGLGRGRA